MIKKNQKIIVLFLAIFFVGIFLRVYNFSDYLRFNPDQARDATLVRDVANKNADWPLLGPQAGGTNFKLGSIFYHFQITSAKIFGISPEKLAYPDLIFSILTIFLLYFFLRKFFGQKISLWTVAIFAVSFYAIKYARFAWNPNSIPFFVLIFLYFLSEIKSSNNRKKWLFALGAGSALGILVQLHSLLLFSLPIVVLFYFAFLFWQKNKNYLFLPVIIFIALIFNFSQIYHEAKTGGKNTQEFFKGLENKSSREGSLPYKLALNSVCHIQANSFMILPVGSTSDCDFIEAKKEFSKNKFFLWHILFATIFSVGGYFFIVRSWQKTKNEEVKNFLGLIILYSGVIFIILIPLASEISLRFFLVLEFMPFIFLGFWFKFLGENFPQKKNWLMAIFAIFLISINLMYVFNNFTYLEGKKKEGKNGFEEITLGEIRFMASFIEANVKDETISSEGNVYLLGKAGELFKIIKPIRYFTDEKGLNVKEFSKKDIFNENDKFFLIDIVNDPVKESGLSQKNQARYAILNEARYRRIKIYNLQSK